MKCLKEICHLIVLGLIMILLSPLLIIMRIIILFMPLKCKYWKTCKYYSKDAPVCNEFEVHYSYDSHPGCWFEMQEKEEQEKRKKRKTK